MSESSVWPTLPSAFTAKRLSRPIEESVASAIQVARCRPDGSQRMSQPVTPVSPAEPGSGVAVTSPGPTSACQSATTSRPFVGTHVSVAGSRSCSPLQKTTLRFVGSTTGRQTAGRAIGVTAPEDGSSRNDVTGLPGGAEGASGDDETLGDVPGEAPADGRVVEAGRSRVADGWAEAEGLTRVREAEAAAEGETSGEGEIAADGSTTGDPGADGAGTGDSGTTILTADASDVGLPAGSTALPRI